MASIFEGTSWGYNKTLILTSFIVQLLGPGQSNIGRSIGSVFFFFVIYVLKRRMLAVGGCLLARLRF